MMQFTNVRHILCASDLTARSITALKRAAYLAKRTGARLTLLHVVLWGREERVTRMRANRAYAQLLSHADRALDPTTSFEVMIRIGEVRDTIAKTARELNADLVVVAPPKSRRFDSIIGTTAERLVRGAQRPVLIAQLESQEGYREVAVAADLSDATVPMIRRMVDLAVLENTWTTIVHALEPAYHEKMRAAGIDGSTVDHYVTRSLSDARQELMQMALTAGLSQGATRVLVHNESPSAAISNVLQYARPELLAIGASRWFAMKRLMIGSVADHVLRTAKCDILVIPNRPSALRYDENALLTTDANTGATESIPVAPRLVPVERGLHQQDRRERGAPAYE